MSLLSGTQVREHINTSLSDDALQRIIDACEEEIDDRYGSLSSQEDVFEEDLTDLLYLSRNASSITAVVERIGTVDTTLAADDYELVAEKRLYRLHTGTNPRSTWGDRITVTYAPIDDSKRRIIVLVDLCKLEVNYRGLQSENIGDYRMSLGDYRQEKERILSGLSGRRYA